MKTTSLALAIIAFCAAFLVVAQSEDPGPSPTASVGCKAHLDHWDCEGPRIDDTATTTPAAAETSHDDHETHHDENAPVTGSADPGPSPTASIGCKSHGDHWDCEGPPLAGSATTPAAAETTHDENSPITGSADPGPSPIASVGCEPHGDHWDCEGPVPATAETSTVVTSSAAVAQSTGAGNALSIDYRIAAAGSVLAMGLFFAAV